MILRQARPPGAHARVRTIWLALVVGASAVGCQALSHKLTNWQMLGQEALDDPINAVGGDGIVFAPPGDDKPRDTVRDWPRRPRPSWSPTTPRSSSSSGSTPRPSRTRTRRSTTRSARPNCGASGRS